MNDFQLICQGIGESMDLTATTDNEGCCNGCISVQLLNLLGNCRSNLLHYRIRQLPYLFRRHGMLDSHNVLIGNFLHHHRILLDLLCRCEVYQEGLYQHFRQLISSVWNHAVSNNATVLGQTDIGGSCANVHKGNIQHTICRWNSNIHCRDWLQSHIGNM